MTSVEDLIDGAAEAILRELGDHLADARMHELAAQALRELTGSLRAARTSLPVLHVAISTDTVTGMLRALSSRVFDRIEAHVSARDLRRVAEWFAAASERTLSDANHRLVALLDALDDHVILLDTTSHVLFLNRQTEGSARRNYGRSREEMIGRSSMEGPQSREFKQYVRGLVARASLGETVAEEFLLPMPQGAVWHEHHFHPVRDAGGEIEAVAICSREIHARKQAEGRLQLLSKIGLLAGLLTGTSELDSILAQAAGLAIPELADWSIFELVQDGELLCSTIAHPDAARAAQAQQDLIDARGTRARRLDVEPGGCIHELDQPEAAALRARDPALHALLQRFGATTAIVVPFVVMGAPIALATFVYGPESGRRHAPADLEIADEIARRAAQIVENARLHTELSQALAYRERVMGILGHDLRNPVSAVLSIAAMLARRADVPERAKQGLEHIHRSAERMEQMIATILDFTQLRFRGAPSLALEPFDLETLARAIVDELRAAHPSRAITIDAGSELHGRWDVSRLGQVISNLVGNALTHGAPDTPVTVQLSPEPERVSIAVSNQGPTISVDALDKLFEPFWQAPSPSGTTARGLGLGLFIVHQIVQAHGGEIAVRSQNAQTTFTVRLPR